MHSRGLARLDRRADDALRAGCACQAESPRRHGPYWQWTRKVAKKTVSRWLGREEAGECRAWVDNDRRLRELVARLEAIGIDRLKADLRRD